MGGGGVEVVGDREYIYLSGYLVHESDTCKLQ